MRAFEENRGLRDAYRVLSLNTDRQGQVYISTMESPDVGACLSPLPASTTLRLVMLVLVGRVPLGRSALPSGWLSRGGMDSS